MFEGVAGGIPLHHLYPVLRSAPKHDGNRRLRSENQGQTTPRRDVRFHGSRLPVAAAESGQEAWGDAVIRMSVSKSRTDQLLSRVCARSRSIRAWAWLSSMSGR